MPAKPVNKTLETPKVKKTIRIQKKNKCAAVTVPKNAGNKKSVKPVPKSAKLNEGQKMITLRRSLSKKVI